MSSRNELGQFEKGTSGNPRGRPPKLPRKISNEKQREDFFDAADTLVTVVEGGKRKLIPAREAIEMQLVRKAASPDSTKPTSGWIAAWQPAAMLTSS